MSNPSKRKGTAFESMLVNWLRERLGDDRIERRALHGSKDMGDIYGLYAHGAQGIIECKAHKTYGPALLAEWRDQTDAERSNADADFALLVVKKRGVGEARMGETPVFSTIRDLLVMSGVPFEPGAVFAAALDTWVETDLESCCRLIEGAWE